MGSLAEFGLTGGWWSVGGVDDRVIAVSGPFLLYGVGDNLGFDLGDKGPDGYRRPVTLIEEIIEPMIETVVNIEDLSASAEPTPPGPTTTTTTDTQPVSVTTEATTVTGPESGTSSDPPIEPEEAAAQAVAGLIAAAAIGAITMAEASGQIAEILGGLGGGSSAVPPQAPTGPFIDPYDQQPLEVDPGTGMVFWPWDGGDGHWVDPSEAPALLDDWNRDLVAERQAQQDRVDSIIAERDSDEAAAARFGDLTGRSRERDAEMLEEIRAGRARIAANETWDERRQAAGERLEAAEAEQQAALDEWWDSVSDDTKAGILTEVESIPDLVRDAGIATRQGLDVAYDEATTWENWRVLGETAAETIYDVAGAAAGGAFGDAAESVSDAASGVSRVGGAIAQAAVNDPVGFVKMLTPIQDFSDAIDGERTLGQRLTSLGMGLVDVGLTLATAGAGRALAVADDLVDAARVADRALDAADAAADTVRVADRALDATDAARDTARAVAANLEPDLADVRRTIDTALDGSEDLARRQIFQGDGMKRAGRLEAAGGLDNATANRLVAVHDEITEGAIRRGAVDSIDDFAARHGVRPKKVMVGNSGSVGPGRSVMTDADRTIVTSFSDGDVAMWQRRHGFDNPADAAADMQREFTRMQKRNAELALNDPTDPAVRYARQNDVSLQEAVADLQRQGRDNPAAAARRLTAKDMDMDSYSGFGSGAGPGDAYPRGYTNSRQSIQGSTQVYTPRADGSVSRYSTSGQAIIDQNELEAVRTFDEAATGSRYGQIPLDKVDNWPADPTRISSREMRPLLDEQLKAAAKYTDAKSLAKAADRAAYIAARSGQPMANPALVQASTAIRNNPRESARILQQLRMTETEFVDATRRMLLDYNPTL